MSKLLRVFVGVMLLGIRSPSMQSFPNMKDDDLSKISTYALEYSAVV